MDLIVIKKLHNIINVVTLSLNSVSVRSRHFHTKEICVRVICDFRSIRLFIMFVRARSDTSWLRNL